MAPIPGSVRVTGFFAPSDSTDTYAVTDSIYGRGSWREAANTTERDAITTDRRREGMAVYVQDVDKIYILKNGITNSDWVELATGVSGTVNVDQGGTGLTSVATGRVPFGNNSTTLATSASLYWDNTKEQLQIPKLVLSDVAVATVEAGKFEFASSVLYFSPTAISRNVVLLDTLPNGQNITLGTGAGSQIGTAANQKLGFFGATPVTQRGTYTTSNSSTLRTLNAQNLTFDDIGNIICTMIDDLKALGLFG
jgi:hypothetical protein